MEEQAYACEREDMIRRLSAVLIVLCLVIGAAVPATVAAKDPVRSKPAEVKSNSDAAKSKLHPRLLKQVEAGSTKAITVFATVSGDPADAASYLAKPRIAKGNGVALVVGTIHVQALPKLAGANGVISVSPVDFKQTGRPLGNLEPRKAPTRSQLDKALQKLYAKEVPYSQAPPLAGSNFEELKDLALLDAKTHEFADAWDAGFTGTGTTVGVMDGGTDFGHPDLIGTWATWSGLTGTRSGWNGWPKAFDPYAALIWLAERDDLVDAGLSWHTKTTAVTCKDWAGKAPQATCPVKFDARLGPSRNFSLPDATKQHTYQFPAGFSKSGNVRMGNHPDDYLLALYGERVAYLVTDATTAGVFDTVYVDLDHDFDFSDEKPVTKASPSSYRDMDGDGYTDLSGGLLYFISDGVTRAPGGQDAFGVNLIFGPGVLTAWSGDYDPGIEGHGTLTASNVVGQGVINGNAPHFSDLPDGVYPGAVIGGAPHAKLAPYGDIYFSFDFSTQFGYFLAVTRGVDITSNSYGKSDVDNDGWDAASQEADYIYDGSRTTPLFSTGNGAPGFGTESPPSPIAGIGVGASTQFGGTGWDSIDRTDQIYDEEVMVWSNRGFGANGSNGVDVVADGAYSAGDSTLNTKLDGRFAWQTWGGTSRSTPVAVGATALVYQAWREAHGTNVPPGFYATAKDILMSSADDLGYEATIQGAGSVNAGDAVQTALGNGNTVSPNEWRAGDYRGDEFPVFSHLMTPGGSDSQEFTIAGGGTWDISDRQLVRTDSETFSLSSKNVSQESVYNFNAPDYLVDLTERVADHPDADLMVIRANYPRDQFDPDGNYQENQAWRLLTYSWTDINHDGNLWTDTSGDGVVDHANLPTISNVDANFDLNFAASEMDKGEYVRIMYHRPAANTLMNFVRDPNDRMADGVFLGLQHQARSAGIPVTDFEVQIDWYENTDWAWVTTPDSASGSFTANISVPEDTPYGMYSGAIVLDNGDESMVVPVEVAVAASPEQDETGAITGTLEFGGEDVAEAQADYLYNNGSVFGANDWGWRAESGDWRFFFADVLDEPADGSLFLARTEWGGAAPYTDIDTLIMSRAQNQFQILSCDDPGTDEVEACPAFGAPYTIDTVGGSPNTNTGAGVWRFDTATGGAEDFVAAPAQEGLQAFVLHQVGWDGADFHEPFSVTVGGASVTPATIDLDTTTDDGSFDITFRSGLALDGLVAEAFGLSQPSVTDEPGQQDDPNDPSSASIKKDITLEHASRLSVRTELNTDDFDLFVVRDANNDGTFTNAEIVASSAGGTANEFVELVAPPDGDYQIWVQGWSVAGTPTVKLTIDPIQGNDLTVSGVPAGAVAANTPITLTIDFSKSMTAGQTYFGELLLGPPTAPTALKVPIQITRN